VPKKTLVKVRLTKVANQTTKRWAFFALNNTNRAKSNKMARALGHKGCPLYNNQSTLKLTPHAYF
jgi:hypothetical protein